MTAEVSLSLLNHLYTLSLLSFVRFFPYEPKAKLGYLTSAWHLRLIVPITLITDLKQDHESPI